MHRKKIHHLRVFLDGLVSGFGGLKKLERLIYRCKMETRRWFRSAKGGFSRQVLATSGHSTSEEVGVDKNRGLLEAVSVAGVARRITLLFCYYSRSLQLR